MPACAWVNLSYMSHAHFSSNITLLRVRIHTTVTVESLLQSGFICMCVCVYRNTQAVRKTWALTYFGSRSCALALVLPASVCVLVRHLLAVIYSSHYEQRPRCKSSSPGSHDGLWHCLLVHTASEHKLWYNTRHLTAVNTSLILSLWSSFHMRKCHLSAAIGQHETAKHVSPSSHLLILIFNNRMESGAW